MAGPRKVADEASTAPGEASSASGEEVVAFSDTAGASSVVSNDSDQKLSMSGSYGQ